jgi:tape measure domain-containing protein
MAGSKMSQVFANTTARIGNTVSGLGGKFSSVFKGMATVAGGIGLYNIGTALARAPAELASAFLGANIEAENLTASLGQLLGTPEKGRAMFENLRKFAKETPFDLGGTAKAAVGMLVSGFSEQEIMPTLQEWGNLVALSPVGAQEGLQRLVNVMGQVRAAGQAYAGDMFQIAALGIPIKEMLAEHLGTTVPAVRKMMQEGSVPAQAVFDAMAKRARSPQFAGTLAMASQTFTGRWTALKDQIWQDLGRVGEPFFDLVKDGMKGLLTWLEGAAGRDFVNALKDAMGDAMTWVRGFAEKFVTFYKSGGFDQLKDQLVEVLSTVGRVALVVTTAIQKLFDLLERLGELVNRLPGGRQAIGEAGFLLGLGPVGVPILAAHRVAGEVGRPHVDTAAAAHLGGPFAAALWSAARPSLARVMPRPTGPGPMTRLMAPGMRELSTIFAAQDALRAVGVQALTAGAFGGFGGAVMPGGGLLPAQITSAVGDIAGAFAGLGGAGIGAMTGLAGGLLPELRPGAVAGAMADAADKEGKADIMDIGSVYRSIQAGIREGEDAARKRQDSNNINTVAKNSDTQVELLRKIAATGAGNVAVFAP